MIIYSLPFSSVVTEEGYSALLKSLNIGCVLGLVVYKKTAINPYSSHHNVFREIGLKFNLQDKLPRDFVDIPKEEKNTVLYPVLYRMLDSLIRFMIEADENTNILILDYPKGSVYLKKSLIYIINSIRNSGHNSKIDIDNIKFYKLNLSLKLAYSFCKYSYMNDSDCWKEEFSCNYSDYTISCELMDEIFEDLAINYGIKEKNFFVEFGVIKDYRYRTYEQIIIEKREEEREKEEERYSNYRNQFDDDEW